jgi:hypothetical protein
MHIFRSCPTHPRSSGFEVLELRVQVSQDVRVDREWGLVTPKWPWLLVVAPGATAQGWKKVLES